MALDPDSKDLCGKMYYILHILGRCVLQESTSSGRFYLYTNESDKSDDDNNPPKTLDEDILMFCCSKLTRETTITSGIN